MASSQEAMRDTSAATRAVKRNAEERRAQFLRGRGWVCLPPERLTEDLREELAAMNADCPVSGRARRIPPEVIRPVPSVA